MLRKLILLFSFFIRILNVESQDKVLFLNINKNGNNLILSSKCSGNETLKCKINDEEKSLINNEILKINVNEISFNYMIQYSCDDEMNVWVIVVNDFTKNKQYHASSGIAYSIGYVFDVRKGNCRINNPYEHIIVFDYDEDIIINSIYEFDIKKLGRFQLIKNINEYSLFGYLVIYDNEIKKIKYDILKYNDYYYLDSPINNINPFSNHLMDKNLNTSIHITYLNAEFIYYINIEFQYSLKDAYIKVETMPSTSNTYEKELDIHI